MKKIISFITLSIFLGAGALYSLSGPDAINLLTRIEKNIKQQKIAVYSQTLREFELKNKQYKKEIISVDRYADYLVDLAMIYNINTPSKYPNITSMLFIMENESEFDPFKIQAELREILASIKNVCTQEEYETLMKKKKDIDNYYEALKQMISKYGISLNNKYNEFKKYLSYIEYMDTFDYEKAKEEIILLKNILEKRIATNKDEIKLLKYSYGFRLYKKYITNKASREDVANWYRLRSFVYKELRYHTTRNQIRIFLELERMATENYNDYHLDIKQTFYRNIVNLVQVIIAALDFPSISFLMN